MTNLPLTGSSSVLISSPDRPHGPSVFVPYLALSETPFLFVDGGGGREECMSPTSY